MRKSRRITFTFLHIIACFLFLSACDDSTPQPADTPDCVEGQEPSGCPEGEICLGSRCYLPCQGDSQCSRWERCNQGVCQNSSQPQDDGGPTPDADVDEEDTDPDIDIPDGDSDEESGDPCSECEEECHEVTQECVQCTESGQCTRDPVCNVARGICIEEATGQCAPCSPFRGCGEANVDCVDRTGETGPWEVVCLTRCEAGCPAGTHCDPSTSTHCIPLIPTISCTTWFGNWLLQTCVEPEDCVPIGSPTTGVDCIEMPKLEQTRCTIACEKGECPPGTTCTDGYCKSL